MALTLALLAGLGACGDARRPVPGAVISNNPCIDAILAEITAPGDIGGVSIYSHDGESASAPVRWARQFPAIGTGAEEIILARPSLLLTGDLVAGGTNAAVRRAGIRVVAVGVPRSIEENLAQIRQVADAIGRRDAGEALVRRIAEETSPVATGAGGRMSAIIWQAGGFVAGRGTVQDELLERAGFVNGAQKYGLGQWDILPLEIMMQDPPDIIFMGGGARGDAGREIAMRRRIADHLHGRTRIVEFPDRLLYCGGPSLIAASRIMRDARRDGMGQGL